MTESLIGENKNHTIIGTVTRVHFMCGSCGKGWQEMGGNHRPTCPHCKISLPAWGMPQNFNVDLE